MKSVELFAGAGGLAMGCSLAGFEPEMVVEWDKYACETLRENSRRDFPLLRNLPLREGDVRGTDWTGVSSTIDLVAGGPPCQPFSMGGKHQANDDRRDMFPATVEIVRRLKPRAFIVENVKGLTRSAFANYYQYILLQLAYPKVMSRRAEAWHDHLLRLQEEHTSGRVRSRDLAYNVVPTLVNAADFGVPQRRERVFLVGFRSDLDAKWSFPAETHSFDALLTSQWITGEYWDRHKVSKSRRPQIPRKYARRVDKLRQDGSFDGAKPWRTVRDALVGLPSPESRAARSIPNHCFQPGARSYPGHTGSPLDLPAKTLKAGGHGVPGGENMLVKDDGDVRYFTLRESARLQTFPDGFYFHGSWSETMRQLGNAVPVLLAQRVAQSVAECLLNTEMAVLSRSTTPRWVTA